MGAMSQFQSFKNLNFSVFGANNAAVQHCHLGNHSLMPKQWWTSVFENDQREHLKLFVLSKWTHSQFCIDCSVLPSFWQSKRWFCWSLCDMGNFHAAGVKCAQKCVTQDDACGKAVLAFTKECVGKLQKLFAQMANARMWSNASMILLVSTSLACASILKSALAVCWCDLPNDQTLRGMCGASVGQCEVPWLWNQWWKCYLQLWQAACCWASLSIMGSFSAFFVTWRVQLGSSDWQAVLWWQWLRLAHLCNACRLLLTHWNGCHQFGWVHFGSQERTHLPQWQFCT